MPILNSKGEVINESELHIFAKMMQESLEEHARWIPLIGGNFLIGDQLEVSKLITQNLLKYKDTTPEFFEKLSKNKENITVEDAFQKIFAAVYNDSVKESRRKYSEDDIEAAMQSCIQPTGDDTQATYYREKYKVAENDEASVLKAASSFKLATKPMNGVEKLSEYNPESDRIVSAAIARMGNSTTLSKVKDLKDRSQHKELTDEDKAEFGFMTATENARIISVDLSRKKNVTFTDLYNAFTTTNAMLRVGDEGGGKMRGQQVAAGSIIGVGSAKTPAAMYNTLNTIADYMTEIKKTDNLLLQRTQAIQLASFAYQMTLSEHVFDDANGRSCRILSDIILQTFGLPPHIPTPNEQKLCGTIGSFEFDFNKGAEVYLEGVKGGDKILTGYKKWLDEKSKEETKDKVKVNKDELDDDELDEEPDELDDDELDEEPDELEKRRQAAARADDADRENLMPIFKLVDNCMKEDSEALENARYIRDEAKKAEGIFRDSKEYKQFEIMANAYASLFEEIHKATEENMQPDKLKINVNNLEPIAKKMALGILKNDVAKDGTIDVDQIMKVTAEFDKSLKSCAKTYENYKMKDHTLDPVQEPDKKRLNKDDIRKVNLMHKVLGEEPLPKDLYKNKPQKEAENEFVM